MRAFLSACAALCCASISVPTLAQESAEPPQASQDQNAPQTDDGSESIVVTGRKLPDKAINRYIDDTLEEENLGQTGQYARLSDPFCPSAIGFSESVKNLIEKRMREVATAAGIKLGDEGKCEPNMHLFAVDDGAKTIDMLQKRRRSAAFGGMSPGRIKDLKSQGGPVYKWIRTAKVGTAEGKLVSSPTVFGQQFDQLDWNRVSPACQNPHLCLSSKVQGQNSFVLIERREMLDVTTTQVADYALLQGLLPVRRDGPRDGYASQTTVLTLFDEDVEPEERLPGLTQTDLALLTALYSAPDDVSADRQRARIVATFRKTLSDSE